MRRSPGSDPSTWIYRYGYDYYVGGEGVDYLAIDFDSSQVSVKSNNAGVYEIDTPVGTVRVNFDQLFFRMVQLSSRAFRGFMVIG